MSSPFLQLPASAWLASNELAFAIREPSASSSGHTLVVLERHVESYFNASPAEKAALWALVDEVKGLLDAELHPDGYSVGFDTVEVAGQGDQHLHIHVVPRFSGDRDSRRRVARRCTARDWRRA